jgi:hypothetical protein
MRDRKSTRLRKRKQRGEARRLTKITRGTSTPLPSVEDRLEEAWVVLDRLEGDEALGQEQGRHVGLQGALVCGIPEEDANAVVDGLDGPVACQRVVVLEGCRPDLGRDGAKPLPLKVVHVSRHLCPPLQLEGVEQRLERLGRCGIREVAELGVQLGPDFVGALAEDLLNVTLVVLKEGDKREQ